ncbi:MAG: putative HIT-like protein [Candidatus Anoxychlamydiales bacterium]|nr:putative HIT-like protein [Candidatus Anoxychlamydiales bacterium]
MKKILFIFLIFSSFVFAENCPFCDRKVIDYQKYYEDDISFGLYEYRPLVDGHCLIIPKRHVQRFEELDSNEITALYELIKKTNVAVQKAYNTSSYMLLQKNGKSVGQTVDHLHFHYIPGKENTSGFWFIMKFLFYPLKQKINPSQMQKATNKIVRALDSSIDTSNQISR